MLFVICLSGVSLLEQQSFLGQAPFDFFFSLIPGYGVLWNVGSY